MKKPSAMPRLFFLFTSALLLGGCVHVKLEPIEVHATLDINVKMERALNDFFGDLDKKSSTLSTPSTK